MAASEWDWHCALLSRSLSVIGLSDRRRARQKRDLIQLHRERLAVRAREHESPIPRRSQVFR